MSDTLGESLIRNLINLGLDEAFPLSRPVPPKSISTERLTDDLIGWSRDTFSDRAPGKPQYPFKPDRSMSLTDSCLSTFNQMKTNDVPPPPGFPPLASLPSNRYKTELCRSFQEHGNCKYGSKCQFAHGESELRGLYRHPKYKTQACRTFYQFGYCPYGSRCHFIHEDKASVEQNPRLLRQSFSFAGFPVPRSTSPPLYDPLSFTRAPSVSPPPAEILSPVFTDSSREMFPFSRYSSGDIHNNTSFAGEPRSRCVCGHGNSTGNGHYGKEDRNKAFLTPNLQRFPSDDSLSDRESYSSTGSSSGSESPTFDASSGKRLSVFARMSVSD